MTSRMVCRFIRRRAHASHGTATSIAIAMRWSMKASDAAANAANATCSESFIQRKSAQAVAKIAPTARAPRAACGCGDHHRNAAASSRTNTREAPKRTWRSVGTDASTFFQRRVLVCQTMTAIIGTKPIAIAKRRTRDRPAATATSNRSVAIGWRTIERIRAIRSLIASLPPTRTPGTR